MAILKGTESSGSVRFDIIVNSSLPMLVGFIVMIASSLILI